MRGLLLLLALALAVPAQAAAADLHATTSTFPTVFAQAQGGDRVLLASGSYGTFTGGAKSGNVTITPETGAAPTMRLSFTGSVTNLTVDGVGITGGQFNSGVRNVTVKNATFTGYTEVAPGSTALNLVFDNDRWGNVGQGAHEGRLSFTGGSGNSEVQVKNSTFGPGGCSDGVQVSSPANIEIGPGNEFMNIRQGGCDPVHVDAIQVYAGNNANIHDNYLHDNEQGIMSPDGVASGYTITNNVIHTSTAYPCMHIGNNRNSTITHNVCLNGSIRLYGGNQGVPSQGIVAQNNVAGIDNSSCTGCTVDHNLARSQVTFAVGTGRCAYATVSPNNTGSDGTDIGLNDCSGAPGPAVQCIDGVDNDGDGLTDFPADPGCSSATDTTESPNPTSDDRPSARFTFSPASPVIGRPVTFDATNSTCDDTPCTFTWVDDGFDGSGGTQWPLGNGSTLFFTFVGVGTKNVRVTVTDADGDTDTTVKAVSVTSSSAPPPVDTTPPDTTITLGPSGTTSDATPLFAFTSSESGSTFQCRVDSGSWAGCTSPWTTAVLSDGDHSVSVRAIDAAGNVDASPPTRSFTVAPPAGLVLLGSSTVQPVADSIDGGSAEAFDATATGSGSVVELSVYLDSGNSATSVVAGIYDDDGGHPGALLTTGTLSSVTAPAWNDITVPGEPLVSGQKYWLAVLGLRGTLRFRDASGGGNCHSESSRSTTLTALPATWQTGATWASCNLSGRAST